VDCGCVIFEIGGIDIFDTREAHEKLHYHARNAPNETCGIKGGQFEIRREFGPLPGDKVYRAYLDGNAIGEARLYGPHGRLVGSGGEAFVSRVNVSAEYRRRGIATALYDVIAADLAMVGATLVPSEIHQTDDARAFWNARYQT